MCERILTKGQDAQFELIDALLLNDHPGCFAELSLSPVYRSLLTWTPQPRESCTNRRSRIPTGQGRPSVHGPRFAFKEPDTWPEPVEQVEFNHERWGQVRLRRWTNLHARADAKRKVAWLVNRSAPPTAGTL